MKLFEIGPRLKELRKAKGFTQESMANIAGISRVTLGKLERGEIGSISIKTLDFLLDTLGYEIDFKSKNMESFGLPSLDSLL